MKNGNWIALHKELRFFLPHGRAYTTLEAMFSYTLDIDNKKQGTISGYAKLWGWDRKKVRRFIAEVGTPSGHFRDRDGTGKEHHLSLKLNNLQDRKDTKGTGTGQGRDTLGDTTIKPNPKPKPKVKDIIDYLNEKAGKHFKPSTDATKAKINARINDGFTIDDFKKVIDIKSSQWKDDPAMNGFLRPETLFGTKFESYLNEKMIEPKDYEVTIDGESHFMNESEFKQWQIDNPRN